MDVSPETGDVYNSELWNSTYTLTETYSLSPKELCVPASGASGVGDGDEEGRAPPSQLAGPEGPQAEVYSLC